jgi:hypothetical protein
MNKQQKYDAVVNAMTTRQREDKEIYTLKEDTAPEVAKALRDVLYNSGEPLDLAYEMLNSAINELGNYTLEQIENDDAECQLQEVETASVYTGVRLSYLNNANQTDISTIMKDYSLDDIATACAVYYDEKVREMITALATFITKK